jgi:hypothetical protein
MSDKSTFTKPAAYGGANPERSKNLFDEATQTEADLAQDAYKRDMMLNLIISGAAQGAQTGFMVAPNAQDVRNKEQLEKLQKLEAQGKLGLTGRERRQAEATMLSPVKALATEDRKRAEGRLATMGNQSAAELDRIERQAGDRAQEAGLAAGMQISKMHLDKAAQQLNELEERIAFKAERQKGRREFAAQTIGQAGGIAGQVMASRSVPQVDLSAIPSEDRATVMELYSEAVSDPNPYSKAQKVRALNSLLKGVDIDTATQKG